MNANEVKDLPLHLVANQVSLDIFHAGHLFDLIADRVGELPGDCNDRMEQIISVALAGRDMCRRAQTYADRLENEVCTKEADHGR